MSGNEISIDFIPNFLKADRKNREKIESERYFNPDKTEEQLATRKTFFGELFEKLETDQEKLKSEKKSAKNLNASAEIIDDIFQKLNIQS